MPVSDIGTLNMPVTKTLFEWEWYGEAPYNFNELALFDKRGNHLQCELSDGIWNGGLKFPKVGTGLHENEHIFALEKYVTNPGGVNFWDNLKKPVASKSVHTAGSISIPIAAWDWTSIDNAVLNPQLTLDPTDTTRILQYTGGQFNSFYFEALPAFILSPGDVTDIAPGLSENTVTGQLQWDAELLTPVASYALPFYTDYLLYNSFQATSSTIWTRTARECGFNPEDIFVFSTNPDATVIGLKNQFLVNPQMDAAEYILNPSGNVINFNLNDKCDDPQWGLLRDANGINIHGDIDAGNRIWYVKMYLINTTSGVKREIKKDYTNGTYTRGTVELALKHLQIWWGSNISLNLPATGSPSINWVADGALGSGYTTYGQPYIIGDIEKNVSLRARLESKTGNRTTEDGFYFYDYTANANLPVLVRGDSQELIVTGDVFTRDELLYPGKKIGTSSVTNGEYTPLKFNLAFSSATEGVFEDTLILEWYQKHENEADLIIPIASFSLYAESVEEDERFGIWLSNLGRDLRLEDSYIFRETDIKEALPDWEILNEKRKELLLEGHNIYDFHGTYKSIVNALKFFGYADMRIKEYWLNVDKNDAYFNTYKHDTIYSGLEGQNNLYSQWDGLLPSKKYKKTSKFGLYYDILKTTGEEDEWGIPVVEDAFMFSIEEVLLKLFGLKDKLERDVFPLGAKIIDVVGEGIYFEKFGFKTWTDITAINDLQLGVDVKFSSQSDWGHIIDLRTFYGEQTSNVPSNITPATYPTLTLAEIWKMRLHYFSNIGNTNLWRDVPGIPVGCPIYLRNDTFDVTWDECNFTWDDLFAFPNVGGPWTWNTIGAGNWYEQEWTIVHDGSGWEHKSGKIRISDGYEYITNLPYIGTYTITLEVWDLYNTRSWETKSQTYTVYAKESDFIMFNTGGDPNISWDSFNLTWNEAGCPWNDIFDGSNTWDESQFTYESINFANLRTDYEFWNGTAWVTDKNNLTPTSKYWADLFGIESYKWDNLYDFQWDDFWGVEWEETFWRGDSFGGFMITDFGTNPTLRIESITGTMNDVTITAPAGDWLAFATYMNELPDGDEFKLFKRFQWEEFPQGAPTSVRATCKVYGDNGWANLYDISSVVSWITFENDKSRPENGTFRGYDYNIWKDSFSIPLGSPVYATPSPSGIPGKVVDYWYIKDGIGTELLRIKSQYFYFIFPGIGDWTIGCSLLDTNGNRSTIEKIGAVKVFDSSLIYNKNSVLPETGIGKQSVGWNTHINII